MADGQGSSRFRPPRALTDAEIRDWYLSLARAQAQKREAAHPRISVFVLGRWYDLYGGFRCSPGK